MFLFVIVRESLMILSSVIFDWYSGNRFDGLFQFCRCWCSLSLFSSSFSFSKSVSCVFFWVFFFSSSKSLIFDISQSLLIVLLWVIVYLYSCLCWRFFLYMCRLILFNVVEFWILTTFYFLLWVSVCMFVFVCLCEHSWCAIEFISSFLWVIVCMCVSGNCSAIVNAV